MLDISLQFLPVNLILDQEAYQHTGIHLTDMDAAQTRGVARCDLFAGVFDGVFVIWKGYSCMMRIKVEKERSLRADKVVG